MLPGSFAGGDVSQLTTYAIVNGVERKALSFTSDRDMASDMPDQVVSGGGVSGSSGTIVWSEADDVQNRETSPWHRPGGWPPSSGDRVQVYVTDGTTSFPRFTGAIDKTSGTVGGGMQSTVIDDRDKLNGSFTHPALLRHHIPYGEGSAYRSVGLSFWYILTAALRSVGIYNTPPAVANVAVSVPLQGSVWPEAGTVTSATGLTAGTHAEFYQAPWGYAASGFVASYLPRITGSATDTWQATVVIAPDSNGAWFVDIQFATNQQIRLRGWVGSKQVTCYWHNGTDFVLVGTLSAELMAGAKIVTMLVKGSSWTIRNDLGNAVSFTLARTGGAISAVRLDADGGSRIAGVQVSIPASTAHEFNSLGFVASTKFTVGNLGATMDMSPRIENRNVAELVDEICQATLTAAWWDESGVLNFIQSDTLRSAAPAQTVTTLDDVTDLSWEDSLLSARSKVEVSWKDPSISKGKQQRKELFRASGDSLVSADTVEVIAEPDGDTEWFGVDRDLTILNTSNWGTYNSRRGSFAGYFYSANGDTTDETGLTMAVTTENLGTAGVKISHVAGTYPTDVEANLATSPTSQTLWAYLRNQNLPVIRGYGEGKWVDAVHVSTLLGPSYAPTLTHDLGYWGQEFFEGGSVAQRIADFIAGMVSTPAPTITGLGVIYDPRRQIGDVVTIQSGILDVTLTALIVGMDEDHNAGDHTQSLTVRIIAASSTRKVTYDELKAAWSGGDYAGLQAVWTGLTYTDFTNEPLEGAPN